MSAQSRIKSLVEGGGAGRQRGSVRSWLTASVTSSRTASFLVHPRNAPAAEKGLKVR